MDHSEEAIGQLIVTWSDGAVDREEDERALDAVALFVERPVILDLHTAIWTAGNDGLDLSLGKVSPDCVGVVALVCEEGIRCAFRQVDQSVISLAIRRFAACQMESERTSEGISQAVKLTGEPAPRAAKSASMSPPFPPAAETWARTVVLSML